MIEYYDSHLYLKIRGSFYCEDIIDKISASNFASELGEFLNISSEQVGLKIGMLISSIFSIVGIFLVLYIIRLFKPDKNK